MSLPPHDIATPPFQTLRWEGETDGRLILLDQTRLPGETAYVECSTVEQLWHAIRELQVRGAPAIGIAAAYGVCLSLPPLAGTTAEELAARVERAADRLASSRPTAVNLFHALDQMRALAAQLAATGRPPRQMAASLLDEARRIHEHDRWACRQIGRHGADLLADGQGVLTHCNAGGLATSELGTALAVIACAHYAGKRLHAYVDETRPLLQGSRLTAWELLQHGIPTTLICDSAAPQLMREGRVSAVVTGADRIAANGDVANKIGTYAVAVAARAHGIAFYVAAPTSTFDLATASGESIPIEHRDPSEVTHGFGRATAPAGVDVYNPAFDVTPAELVTAVVTEYGVIRPVTTEEIRRVVGHATASPASAESRA